MDSKRELVGWLLVKRRLIIKIRIVPYPVVRTFGVLEHTGSVLITHTVIFVIISLRLNRRKESFHCGIDPALALTINRVADTGFLELSPVVKDQHTRNPGRRAVGIV